MKNIQDNKESQLVSVVVVPQSPKQRNMCDCIKNEEENKSESQKTHYIRG